MTPPTEPRRAPGNPLSFGRPAGQGGLARLGSPPVAARPNLPAVADPAPVVSGTRVILSVPWQLVAQNPLNDRENYDDLSDIQDIVTGQTTPCEVVTRRKFLALYPPTGDRVDQEYAQAIGAAEYVVVDGSRRRGAVEEYGVPELLIWIADDQITTRADFLTDVGKANHHKPLNAIEEARALSRLVAELDSQTKAGERLGLSKQVVSQRLAVLKLCPQLLALVRSGEMPLRAARRLGPKIGDLPAAQQIAAWRADQRKSLTAVNNSEGGAEPGEGGRKAASASPRRWVITEKQTPAEVSSLILERFSGAELDELVAALTAKRPLPAE